VSRFVVVYLHTDIKNKELKRLKFKTEEFFAAILFTLLSIANR
jgi:hypothetical protein